MVGLGSSSESGGRDGPGTVELIIVRHGESTNNVVMKELLGRTDLTEDAVKRWAGPDPFYSIPALMPSSAPRAVSCRRLPPCPLALANGHDGR